MHYVNGDIILSADGAERLQYLLSHPNPEEVQKKLKTCIEDLAKMNYRENEDGTASFDIDIEV